MMSSSVFTHKYTFFRWNHLELILWRAQLLRSSNIYGILLSEKSTHLNLQQLNHFGKQHFYSQDNKSTNRIFSGIRSVSTSCYLKFHASSPFTDSFYGLNLSEDETIHVKQIQPQSVSRCAHAVKEALVVTNQKDKRKSFDSIAEFFRAELSAHFSSKSKNKTVNDNSYEMQNDDHATAEAITTTLGPYERRILQLERATQRHSQYRITSQKQIVEYTNSCITVGELNYQLGHLEKSRDIYMDTLKFLLQSDVSENEDILKSEIQVMIAKVTHSLGAIHARSGEYDEANLWYQESLKRKHAILSNSNEKFAEMHCYHFEVGKTYNGLAVLEVMRSSGNVDWEKAMSFFRDADRHYLIKYLERENDTKNFHTSTGLSSNTSPIPISEEIIHQMSPHQTQLVINIRHNMGELLRQQGRHKEAIELFKLALQLAQIDVARMKDISSYSITYESHVDQNNELQDCEFNEALITNPAPDERRNVIIDLLVEIADCLVSIEKYDEAAETYEKALSYHVAYRRLKTEHSAKTLPQDKSSQWPLAMSTTINVSLDLSNATTVEAAIRNNLARTLACIGQEKLALEQYESSLTIKRHIAGNEHIQVGHTLMEMGALLGGPMKDLSRAMNCFKEALYIYRHNLNELVRADFSASEVSGVHFYDTDERVNDINEYIQNASKNIGVIQAFWLKDRDGVGPLRQN